MRVPRPLPGTRVADVHLTTTRSDQRNKDRNHQIERSATQSWVAPSLVYLLFLHLYKEKCHYLRRGLRDAARNDKRRSSSSETCPSTSASADSTSCSIPLRFRADPYGLRDRMTDTFVVTCSVCVKAPYRDQHMWQIAGAAPNDVAQYAKATVPRSGASAQGARSFNHAATPDTFTCVFVRVRTCVFFFSDSFAHANLLPRRAPSAVTLGEILCGLSFNFYRK